MQYPLLKTPVYDKMIQECSMTFKEFKTKFPRTSYAGFPYKDDNLIILLTPGVGRGKYEDELRTKHFTNYQKAKEYLNSSINYKFIPGVLSGVDIMDCTSYTSKPQVDCMSTREWFLNFKTTEILMNYFHMMDEKTDEDAWKGGRRKYKKTRKNRS